MFKTGKVAEAIFEEIRASGTETRAPERTYVRV